jgi:thiamine-phosphate pyrophosphorylase
VLPRLYAILDIDLLEQRRLDPLRVLDVWLDAGVRLIQLRAKTMASGAMLALAETMAVRARAAGATFVVNDRADIAKLAGADGVHVGQDDLPPADVRRVLLPAPAIVGLSTHDEAQARDACAQPISYLAIGPVFATTSKAQPDPVVGLAGVRMAAALAAPHALPVIAIGGITLERAPSVIAAGASSVAVISDLLADDLAARARAFVDALSRADSAMDGR